jgi:hypothetical protein
MALRIGFDLDGVFADMELALVHQAEELFGSSLKRHEQRPSHLATRHSIANLVPKEILDDAPLQHDLKLTASERRLLWRHVLSIDGFWESLDEIEPGSVARLAAIAAERRWEIIFLTKRPATAGATSQVQSQRWLEAKGFRLPSVYVVTASRGVIAAGLTLDIVVDDTPENCIDVASDSKARTIAIFRTREVAPPAGLRRMGIHLMGSVEECLDLLVEIDSSVKRHPGALERVMQTLGLRQPPGAGTAAPRHD